MVGHTHEDIDQVYSMLLAATTPTSAVVLYDISCTGTNIPSKIIFLLKIHCKNYMKLTLFDFYVFQKQYGN